MIGKIKEFQIRNLWGEKQVKLEFTNNKLIIVGENGSGKTTILRILYETLACKWALLSVEEFSEIEIFFSSGKTLLIEKSKLQKAKQLFVDISSSDYMGLPYPVRRELMKRAEITGREITYDQVFEATREYGYPAREILQKLEQKVSKIEKNHLSQYNQILKEQLNCSILYLPTYRRVENKALFDRYRRIDASESNYSNSAKPENSIEIAKNEMGDVEYFIRSQLQRIRQKADISASRLNYECFKGILSKASDNVEYKKDILSEDEIEKVFGSINEAVLSAEESEQIKRQLKTIASTQKPDIQTYDQIVYYYYYMLHKRLSNLKRNEELILAFFKACNTYLTNKQFVYDEKDYSYSIEITTNKLRKKIGLESLSSGEKQVVSIFSYLYLSQLQEVIVLIDEPELSLSVPWQKTFLRDIANGQKCIGLVSVTHSPFVYDNELRKYTHSLEEFIT